MSGSGYDVEPRVLQGMTAMLREGSATLEGAPAPPPTPEAGACTAAIAAAVAFFADSIGGVVEGLDIMGGLVEQCSAGYLRDDGDAGGMFTGLTFPGE